VTIDDDKPNANVNIVVDSNINAMESSLHAILDTMMSLKVTSGRNKANFYGPSTNKQKTHFFGSNSLKIL
jgi:hypothetical protein